jgi:hypothetical protein
MDDRPGRWSRCPVDDCIAAADEECRSEGLRKWCLVMVLVFDGK